MDSIASILPQIASANSASGNAAPDIGESGLFASLLAAQTTPVTPVPAVNSRPGGDARFATQLPASETGSVLASLTTTSPTPSIAASSTTGHTAETGIPTVNVLPPGDPTATASTASGQPGLPMGVNPAGAIINGPTTQLATPQSAEPNTVAKAGASGQPVVESPVTNTTASLVAAKTPTGPETTTQSKSATANSVETVKPAATSVGLSSPQVAHTPTTQATNVAAPAPSPSTIPNTATPASQTVTQPALPIAAQAGVQARRDAAPSERNASSIALTGSKSAASSPAANTNSITPDLKSASTPPPPAVMSPQGQPPQGELLPDAARLAPAGDKPAPPPLADLSVSDAETDGERVDLSTLRAAEASRTAERPGTAAGTARFTPANAGSLAAQIAAKFQNGDRKFAIRMDPPELGRIEVKMHVGNDNRVHAILSAERPETLNDMRQYARELERALEEAGLQLENDGLSFELSQGDENTDENHPGPGGFSNLEFAEDLSGPITAAAMPAELYGFRLTTQPGVNIRL
jgi:flagellar hook-length control protein FliK